MAQNKNPFADADAFIQAYKKEFIEPEHIAKIVDNESNGTLYFFDDGQFSVYYGYNTLVTGQWGKDETGVTIVIGADKYELISYTVRHVCNLTVYSAAINVYNGKTYHIGYKHSSLFKRNIIAMKVKDCSLH